MKIVTNLLNALHRKADQLCNNFQYTYTVLEDGTVEITHYRGKASALNIPKQLKNREVTAIGSNAFANCRTLTSVYIPSSVRGIAGGAFEGCASLTRINLPLSITWIDSSAFDRCPSLKGVCVDRISYAESWCRANGIPCVYTTGGGFED